MPTFEQELALATHDLMAARMGFARAWRTVVALHKYQQDAQDLIDWQWGSGVRDSDWNLWINKRVPNDNNDLLQPNL